PDEFAPTNTVIGVRFSMVTSRKLRQFLNRNPVNMRPPHSLSRQDLRHLVIFQIYAACFGGHLVKRHGADLASVQAAHDAMCSIAHKFDSLDTHTRRQQPVKGAWTAATLD